ncbi:MAG: hypothetical protein HRU19_21380 [Pseudobacteriovorax sp.]|nr:hypothetical protein [Pseudobacteriovorax sp.]
MSKSTGKLILAANSIGLLQDIPTRSLIALKTSDELIFEEDRPARQALKAAGIHREYTKLTEHLESDTLEQFETAILNGKSVCYMSDQGMPTLADPGGALLKIAYSLGAKVEIIPGPSSISTALSACPFDISRFNYIGFLERDQQQRQNELVTLAKSTHEPLVFLDTPYRRKALLGAITNAFGKKRKAMLALDISGQHEEYIYEDLGILAQLDYPKLNFVLVVEGKSNPDRKLRPSKKRRV